MLFRGGGRMQSRPVKPPWLIVVGADAVARADTLSALGIARHEHLQFEDLTQIPGATLRAPAVIVLAVEADPTRSPIAAIRRFRIVDIGTPLIISLSVGSGSVRKLARFARAGVDEIVLLHAGESTAALVRSMRHRFENALASGLIDSLVRQHPSVRHILSYILRNCYRKMHVADVAHWFGVWPETISRRIRRACLPAPHRVTYAARVLYIAQELERSEIVSRAAVRVGFSSSKGLGNFLTRAVGLSATGLVEAGGLAFAVRHAEGVLRSGKA